MGKKRKSKPVVQVVKSEFMGVAGLFLCPGRLCLLPNKNLPSLHSLSLPPSTHPLIQLAYLRLPTK